MENNNRQARAIEKAQKIIQEAEKRRAGVTSVRGIEGFRDGQLDILKTPEHSDSLAKYLIKLFHQKGGDAITIYLERLGDGSLNSDQDIREKAVFTLSLFTSSLKLDAERIVISKLHAIFVTWLRAEEDYINGYGVACKQIQDLGEHLLAVGQWKEVEPLLVTIYQILNGILEKSGAIQGMVLKIQENLASKKMLEMLTNTYLDQNDARKNDAENLLGHLGRRSVIYLLNRLMHSEDREERVQLIRLIPGAGNTAVPVLVDCLAKKPPWFVVRNVIFIISEIGDSSLFSMVRPYTNHRDIRVQQQVVSCIAKFGGNKMQERLLEALPLLDDEIKVQLVMELGKMEGEDVASTLIELLEKRHSFSERVRDNLIRKICVSLKFFPFEIVAQELNDFIIERNHLAIEDDVVLTAAKESLSIIEPKLRHDTKSVSGEKDFVSFDDDPAEFEKKIGQLREIEDQAFALVEKDSLDEACKFIFNHIRMSARDKDFITAEHLRDKLLEINPMALNEVIQAGELIEEEKSSAITSSHIAIWNELYEHMTTEEFNAVYYCMRQENYNSDEYIIKAGETDPSLYFINSGLVSLTCMFGDKEVFLKRLQPGDIVGVEEFFSVSVWTSTLVAQSDCQVNVLERESFKTLREIHPGLEEKLQNYCAKYDILPELIKMSGGDRREFPRYPVSVIIGSMLLDPYGNPGKRSFKGEMVDISRGGLCFSIHISSKENARLLLGRQIVSEIKIGKAEALKCSGLVVGVKFNDVVSQDYTIHVRFHTKIEQAQVIRVVNLVL